MESDTIDLYSLIYPKRISLRTIYDRVVGTNPYAWWSERSADQLTVSHEQKKMIICVLCDRIKVSGNRDVRIVADMVYGQLCG